jgi:hypothetical protein
MVHVLVREQIASELLLHHEAVFGDLPIHLGEWVVRTV